MAVATFGTTGAGVIDPVAEIGDVCKRYGLWLHVDAAWAAAVCLSPTLRPLCAGFGSADSLTWDAHKWLQVPMGAGMFLCTRQDVVEDTFGIGAGYMPPSVSGGVDGYDTSPQWSRRGIGIKVLAQVATLGDQGLSALVDDMTRVGGRIRQRLVDAGWTIINDTPLPLVCFTHKSIEEGRATIEDVRDALYRRGRSWVSKVTFSTGRKGFRACVTNGLTRDEHVDELVSEMASALAEASSGHPADERGQ
jgi:glutamate/tyrosine decarboxylase-like PLP-dependent enzyme